MNMARKFIRMGITRAKRYANHKGGRKYDKNGKKLEMEDHEGRKEKLEVSEVFREIWVRCSEHEEYQRRKGEVLKEQREYDRLKKSSEKK